MIRFLKNVELEVVEWYDEENDETHTKDETFSEGEVVDVDICSPQEGSGRYAIQVDRGRNEGG
jgi:hypothetical protein